MVSSSSSQVRESRDGIEITEQYNYIDPITKGPLLNPVKNKRCGHIYGKDIIIQILTGNPQYRYRLFLFLISFWLPFEFFFLLIDVRQLDVTTKSL